MNSSVPVASISAWFGSLHRRKPQPNPTAKNLWEQVHFSHATHGSDPDTPTLKPEPTLLVTRLIKKLLTQTPTSQNRSKAVRYLTQHPGTPYILQHLTLCVFPGMSHPDLVLPPPCIKVSVYCNRGLQAICPNPHAAPMVGHGVRHPFPTICPIHRSLPPAAFLQPHVAMLQHLHCHLATLLCRIIAWRHQGTLLLHYYDTVMQTCHTNKENFWVNSLRSLRH